MGIIAGKGSEMWPVDITRLDEMDATFRANTTDKGKQWILYRFCDSCALSHRHIYYRRLTRWNESYTNADGEEVPINSINYFLNDWMLLNNEPNVDYSMHSTLEDALAGTGAWNKDCRKQSRTVGFPHDCSKNNAEYVHCQWNTYNRGNQCDHWRYNTFDHAFYLPKTPLLDDDFITPAEADRRLSERVLIEPTEEEMKGNDLTGEEGTAAAVEEEDAA